MVTKPEVGVQSLASRFNWLPGPKDYIPTFSLRFIASYLGWGHTPEQECPAEETDEANIQAIPAGQTRRPCTRPQQGVPFSTMQNGPARTSMDLL